MACSICVSSVSRFVLSLGFLTFFFANVSFCWAETHLVQNLGPYSHHFNTRDLPAIIDLSSFTGADGLFMQGAGGSNRAGWSVSAAGDVNDDGIDDVVIGAPYADPNGLDSGAAYVIFGSTSLSATLDLSTLDGTNGFKLNGVAANDLAGWLVSGAGDVNDDGIDDVVIGAPLASPNGLESGAAYVIFGSSSVGGSGTLELSTLNGGSDPETVSGGKSCNFQSIGKMNV